MFSLESVTKTYRHREETVRALDKVSLGIEPGDFVAVTGGSGSGKTTLLLTLGGLNSPSSGRVLFRMASLYDLSPRELASYRARTVGFVLQAFNLIPYLTALENVQVPMLLTNGATPDKQHKARALLDRLGLSKRKGFLPRELSVGQQQRVAIARALANDPEVILADEPTGNLDPKLAFEILEILQDLNETDGRTVVLVTHSPDIAGKARRMLNLHDGRLCAATGRPAHAHDP